MKLEAFVRKPNNYDVDEVSDETGLFCADPSLASQEFAEEVDINTIARRFGLFGEMPEGVSMPLYGDFEGVSDYHSAMNVVAQAREAFDQMPAEVRARFQNDPGRFVDFVSSEDNREEARKMGLLVPQAERLGSDAALPDGGANAPPSESVGTVAT